MRTTTRTTLRILTILAAVAVTLSGCGAAATPTSAPTATSGPVATPTPSLLSGPFTEADLVLDVGGVPAVLLADSAPVLAKLGKETSYSEAASCLFVGMDKTFDYTYLQVFTIPKDKTDLLDGIYLLDDRYATARGIRVGDTKEAVIAAYGEKEGADSLIYNVGGDPDDISQPYVQFVIEDGKVSAISYYSASNSQGQG